MHTESTDITDNHRNFCRGRTFSTLRIKVCSEGVFEHKFGVWKKVELLSISTNSIRGNDLNDIFVVGDYGLIYHFNGLSWQLMSSINSNKGYSEVSTFKNIVAICGNQQGKGIIEIGRRN